MGVQVLPSSGNPKLFSAWTSGSQSTGAGLGLMQNITDVDGDGWDVPSWTNGLFRATSLAASPPAPSFPAKPVQILSYGQINPILSLVFIFSLRGEAF